MAVHPAWAVWTIDPTSQCECIPTILSNAFIREWRNIRHSFFYAVYPGRMTCQSDAPSSIRCSCRKEDGNEHRLAMGTE